MTTLTFIATLESETILSETSATAGSHCTLDYLPGACFLGSCAAQLYGTLSSEDAFTVFHSGNVRFGNAYPLSNSGIPTLPIPLSWHHFKGETAVSSDEHDSHRKRTDKSDKRLRSDVIKNLLHTTESTFHEWENSGKQPKQIRDGFMTLCGVSVINSANYRLKTAIDRNTKRAAEAQLFGYECLKEGSRWWFTVECDSSVSQKLCDEIAASFRSKIRIGRSRTAENGIVTVVQEKTSIFAPVVTTSTSPLLHVYCLTDLALRETSSGVPVTVPSGSHFDLPHTRFKGEKSFLRTRSYAPFNGKRKANDLERHVICKGSVITFEKQDASVFTAEEIDSIRKALTPGTGMYRQDGLGRVLVNPGFLMSESISFSPSLPTVPPAKLVEPKLPVATMQLTNWLLEKSRDKTGDIEISQQVEEWTTLLIKAITLQEREGNPCPGNSQWGAVRDIASSQQLSHEELNAALFGVKGLCTHVVSQTQWAVDFQYEGDWKSFAEFLRTVVVTHYSDSGQVCKALYLLAERIPKKLNQRTGGK